MTTKSGVVFFAHGKESGPWGIKIKRLAKVAEAKGFYVESPDYSDLTDPEERVDRLISLLPEASKFLVLVGSSMGSYVSTVVSETFKPDGLFLLAPAFYLNGYANQDPHPYAKVITIVHGWNDEVVPVENAIRFAKRHKAQLHLLDSDHRLVSALPIIENIFGIFLEQIMEDTL